jgi:uncharacterized protein YpmS
MTLYLLLIALAIIVAIYMIYRRFIHHDDYPKSHDKKKHHNYTFKL